MTVDQLFEQAAGEWTGEYRLWFRPDTPPDTESATRASVTAELDGHSLLLRYDWQRDETTHHGIAIISRADDGGIEMGWSDSFHWRDGVSRNQAIGTEPKVLTQYGPDDEPWGWRTEFDMPSADELTIRAFNILPDGTEALATEAVYRRA